MALRKCVVIACVSFETAMIVEPAVSYGADEIHLFHYTRDPDSENGKIYNEFYDEVYAQLREKLHHAAIIEHSASPIYDFKLMFRDLLQTIAAIKGTETPDRKIDILINSSAGTSEFSAAAIIVSMMSPGVDAFTVGTREFTVKNENIRDLYYSNGKPVGLTEHTNSPHLIPNFDIDMPEENLVRALRSYFNYTQNGRSISATKVIQQFKDEDIWKYQASPRDKKTDIKQKETMYYQRHYLGVWLERGWVEKPAGYTKYRLTENGMMVIQTFYTDEN